MSAQQSTASQQLDAEGGIDMGIPVRAVNRSTEPVTWMYDRKKYVLQPDTINPQGTYVPYMAMCLYQGDPRAIDIPGGRRHQQHRRMALEHLRILYGVYEMEEKWANVPLVECYPIDSDVRFETVLHDRDGAHLSGEVQAASQVAFMQEQMARMAQQLQVMQGQVDMARQEEAAIAASNTDPADLERQATEHVDIAPEQSMAGPAPMRKSAAKGGRAAREGADVPVTRDGE